MTKTFRAFAPGGITSFFEICDQMADGKPLSNEESIGARGGGFVLEKGVITEVALTSSEKSKIQVFINGKHWPNAETTKTVADLLLTRIQEPYDVIVNHKVSIPIGAGFGSSAGGALGTALALGRALGINLTVFQAGKIAHVAEVRCRTGLGTVGPIIRGGCVISVEPGAPGIAVIDRIPTFPEHRIVTGFCNPILTKKVLSSPRMRAMVNHFGKETVDKILADPSLENFMNASKTFGRNAGFATSITEKLLKLAEKNGAIGAAQNMVGEAVHALTTIDKAEKVVEAFKKVSPAIAIQVLRIDVQGARLLR